MPTPGFACNHCPQGCGPEQPLKRADQDGLKEMVQLGLVYFEREERDLHMLLFPEVLDQVHDHTSLLAEHRARSLHSHHMPFIDPTPHIVWRPGSLQKHPTPTRERIENKY